jgi:hypothetical protein
VNAPAQTRDRPSEVVAGLLATLSILASALGLVQHPVRLTAFALLLALVAAGMGGRHQRLAAFAVAFGGACFIVGTFLAIVTRHAIF